MRGVIGIVGAVLTILVVADLVNAMLVPRGGIAPVARASGQLVFRAYRLAMRTTKDFARQDRMLATAAPVALIVQLVVYIVILIVTMGMVVYGLSPLDSTTALYQSGSTLTTLGIVAPITGASAVATFVAAFLGLVAIAIFIGYLLTLYSAFTARESLVARWSLAAGEPAWAPGVFARATLLDIPAAEVLDASRWTDWTCDLRTTITVSPALAWFRSPSPLRHWSTTLLSVLDTAALRLACGVDATRHADITLVAEGIITGRVLNGDHRPHTATAEESVVAALAGRGTADGSCITDADWQPCAEILAKAGLLDDGSAAGIRARFEALRALYAPQITTLARDLHAVRAPWSGDRSPTIAFISPVLPTATREEKGA
jgi:hypothetical protein